MMLSVDEKTQIQALDRTEPMLKLRPGQIEWRTYLQASRHGELIRRIDIMTGEVMDRITQRQRAQEFLDFLRQIDNNTSAELDLHLILDRGSTHKTAALKACLEKYPRLKLHFTPISASWLSTVEGWFSQLERCALYRGIFTSVADLSCADTIALKAAVQKMSSTDACLAQASCRGVKGDTCSNAKEFSIFFEIKRQFF